MQTRAAWLVAGLALTLTVNWLMSGDRFGGTCQAGGIFVVMV
jgi:hypothetical protein